MAAFEGITSYTCATEIWTSNNAAPERRHIDQSDGDGGSEMEGKSFEFGSSGNDRGSFLVRECDVAVRDRLCL